MNRSIALVKFGAALAGVGLPAAGLAGEFQIGEHRFTLPEEFVIERVAGPPLVDRPIVADFDDRGRLYVADSSGSNEPVAQQLEKKPHRIVRLEDTDGDGHYDRSVVFADGLMFPEGVLWHEGAIYCGAPPTIWRLRDTNDDGVADEREEWFKGKTLTGCANDLHGPYLGPDGWIYWCKGAFAKQHHPREGRAPIEDAAAHIFRCRPDGSAFDSVMSGGMDNPVEIVFTPEGETIFSTTFVSHPQEGRRDGLVHALYGGVYPKSHGVLDGLKRTGDLLPAMTHLGPAASCGLERYASSGFGPDYEGDLFSCLFNLRKIMRHELVPTGATFETRDTDFLVSDHPDFHPTDVLEDADGSLLVIDTGGWYKLCCPTSQLPKPEVLGGIYRIRKRGMTAPKDPRGLDINWTAASPRRLTRLLDDDRPAVRERATAALASRGDRSVPALRRSIRQSDNPAVRQRAIWTLSRIGSSKAVATALEALSDARPEVRQTAAHVAGVHRRADAVAPLLTMVVEDAPHARRTAAAALAQIRDDRAPEPLLKALRDPVDRSLEHALIFALIETARSGPLRAVIQADENRHPASVTRGALVALDQMDDSPLKASDVVRWLDADDADVRETALWITLHRPAWGAELSGYLEARVRAAGKTLTPPQQASLVRQLGAFSRNDVVQKNLARWLTEDDASSAQRQLLLAGMAAARLASAPPTWGRPLADCLHDGDPQLVAATIGVIENLPIPRDRTKIPAELDFHKDLLAVARRSTLESSLRIRALAAMPGAAGDVDDAVFGFLMDSLKLETSPGHRMAASKFLETVDLNPAQIDSLLERVPTAGALELPGMVAALARLKDPNVATRLINALPRSRGFGGLWPDALRRQMEPFPDEVRQRLDAVLEQLETDTDGRRARLESLLAHVKDGDRERGRRLFESSQTACATCHMVGYVGGRVGPDLTRIGAIRTELDLLESILYPSRSFVRSYEPMVVLTRDGEQYNGVLREEGADTVVLITGATASTRLAKDTIRDIHPGAVSIMPQGLDEQLSPIELADLVVFLKSLK